MAHTMAAGMPLDDLNWESRSYSPWRSYGQAKLSNVLFAKELARRWGRGAQRICCWAERCTLGGCGRLPLG